ncbi:MAG: hypothetical protein D6788_00485 [Planctomycetota bacterium]|nr:MAG: hypothetical protein D6788_00485 [Planctomycetota bacterium]
MLQCEDCELFRRRPDGSPELTCDPFRNIKEPYCLWKWSVLQLGVIARSHEATLEFYRRVAPLQEKMFRYMEREIDEAEEADRWKTGPDDEDDDDIFRI